MNSRRQQTGVETSEMTFGQLLHVLREDRKLSLKDLAAGANVSKGYLSNLEHDIRSPSTEIAEAIDRALEAGGELVELAVPRPRARATRERIRPAQLPAALRSFVPRQEALRQASAALDAHEGLIAFDGPPGVGKTAFTVHWAHTIAPHFPDGVLFTDLRGFAADSPEDPAVVLGRFLRALGASPQDIPSDLDGRVALYRTLLEATRTLVVLDNAVDADQIRPLLPSSPRSLALVTSRNRLSGAVVHDGAVRITLRPMSSDEALDLMRSVLGARVDGDLAAARVIADRAGRLPLALRIAGERANLLPTVPLRTLADELTRRQPLDVLTADETLAVRTVLSWSHDALPDSIAATFRQLGLHPGGPIRIEAAAALIGLSPLQAQGHLSALATVHLVEQTAQDKFVMHDLVQAYALERVRELGGEEANRAAVSRLVDLYLNTGAAAIRMLWPSRPRRPLDVPRADMTTLTFHQPADAVRWFEDELQLLVRLVRCGTRWNVTSAAYLPVVVNEMLFHRRAWSWWVPALRDALEMARQGGHRDAEAWALETLGDAGIDELKAGSSAGLYRQAMQIRTELGDLNGLAACHVGLGRACYQLNDLDAAIAHLETARRLSTEAHDQWEYAVASAHLASVLAASGDAGGARSLLTDVQTIFDEAEDLMSSGCTSTLLAGLAESNGEYEVALRHLQKALCTFSKVADVWSQAHIHRRVGDLHADRGNLHGAHKSWSAAADLLSGNIEPTAAGLRRQLIESLKEDV
ncbi:helix-turn-helix domain-containing protein [Lentzea sp. BCCO 10_0061]|uniref:Helix-turn-helix domain-containing protein n=1 Tax=Lentzea sokolovensis TaxID=3095429 RepID=A0ABU4VBV1_9PSEU|nr:helix-turn-helix domain-containing protein [Lentzea sp. BCCO 10_0061]MDX8148426.1 helix-turn-helix domain-containing protein [Lentzea sp. BCCO 10_0061]